MNAAAARARRYIYTPSDPAQRRLTVRWRTWRPTVPERSSKQASKQGAFFGRFYEEVPKGWKLRRHRQPLLDSCAGALINLHLGRWTTAHFCNSSTTNHVSSWTKWRLGKHSWKRCLRRLEMERCRQSTIPCSVTLFLLHTSIWWHSWYELFRCNLDANSCSCAYRLRLFTFLPILTLVNQGPSCNPESSKSPNTAISVLAELTQGTTPTLCPRMLLAGHADMLAAQGREQYSVLDRCLSHMHTEIEKTTASVEPINNVLLNDAVKIACRYPFYSRHICNGAPSMQCNCQ